MSRLDFNPPLYTTTTFRDIWGDDDEFMAFVKGPLLEDGTRDASLAAPIQPRVSDKGIALTYWLLFAKYANSPIANYDIEQFAMKLLSTMFQHGPTWEKRLEIQEKLHSLNLDEGALFEGARAIYNSAANPDNHVDNPDKPLDYVNSQNSSLYTRGKMDAYTFLWSLLRTDVSEEYLEAFRPLFKIFVAPEKPLLFGDYDEED